MKLFARPPLLLTLLLVLMITAVALLWLGPPDAWLRPGPRFGAAPSPYHAALNSLFAEPRNAHLFWGEDFAPLVLVLEESTAAGQVVADSSSVPYLLDAFPELDSSTVWQFVELNQRAIPLGDTLELALPVQWLRRRLADTLRSFPGDIWAAFYGRFPGAQGWGTVSQAAYSSDSTYAILYVGNQRGALAGAGYWVLLRQTAGGWVVSKYRMTWVS